MRNGTVPTSQIFFTINKLELQTSRDPNCSNYLILIDLKMRHHLIVLHHLNITFNVDEPAVQDALVRSFLLHRFRQFLEFGNLRFLHDHISKSSNRQGEHTFLFKRSSKS